MGHQSGESLVTKYFLFIFLVFESHIPGPFQLTPEQFFVGLISDLITFVPSLVVIWLFKHVRAHRSSYEHWVINYHRAFVAGKKNPIQGGQPKVSSGKRNQAKQSISVQSTQSQLDTGLQFTDIKTAGPLQNVEEETFNQLARESASGAKLRRDTRKKLPPSLDQLRDALIEDEFSDSDSYSSE